MSGCFGGCTGACGHRTGISQDSSQQEGFGSHCQQLQSPQATGRVVECQLGRKQGRAGDGVALATMGGTCLSALPGSPSCPDPTENPVGDSCGTAPHSQQVALHSSPDGPIPVEPGMSPPSFPGAQQETSQLSLLSDSLVRPPSPDSLPGAISCPQATEHSQPPSLHSGGVQTTRVPPWDLTQPLSAESTGQRHHRVSNSH